MRKINLNPPDMPEAPEGLHWRIYESGREGLYDFTRETLCLCRKVKSFIGRDKWETVVYTQLSGYRPNEMSFQEYVVFKGKVVLDMYNTESRETLERGITYKAINE